MIKTIINLFTYRKPEFARFHAEDVVIEGKAYFLFTWELENAYWLKVPALKYSTSKRRGSAYVVIPDGVDQIELIAVTLWCSARVAFKIRRIAVNILIDFKPIPIPPVLHAGTMYKPNLNLTLKTPVLKRQLSGVKTRVFNLNQP